MISVTKVTEWMICVTLVTDLLRHERMCRRPGLCRNGDAKVGLGCSL